MERAVLELDFPLLKLAFFKALVFERPFFVREPDLEPETQNDSRDVKIRKALERASKYRDLLDILRNKSKEIRWLLVALWLKHEGICQPEEFLPSKFLQTQATNFFRGFSFRDIQLASVVEIWRPYFEELMDALRGDKKRRHRYKEVVEEMGFDSDAIACCQGKRRAIPAICDWLPGCGRLGKGIDTPTLRNAYSRCSKARDRVTSAQASQKT